MKCLDDNWKQTNCLGERFNKLKCVDETNFKTIMSDENHMYMYESYKKHEIFG